MKGTKIQIYAGFLETRVSESESTTTTFYGSVRSLDLFKNLPKGEV
jgi:hypothetical protein